MKIFWEIFIKCIFLIQLVEIFSAHTLHYKLIKKDLTRSCSPKLFENLIIPGSGKVVFGCPNVRCSKNQKILPHYQNNKYYFVCQQSSILICKCDINQYFNERLSQCIGHRNRNATKTSRNNYEKKKKNFRTQNNLTKIINTRRNNEFNILLRRLNNFLKTKEDVNGTTTLTNCLQGPTTESLVATNTTTYKGTTLETTTLSGSEWTTTNSDITGNPISTNSYSETTETIFLNSNETTTENILETNETTSDFNQVSKEVTTDVPATVSTTKISLESITTTTLPYLDEPIKSSSNERIEKSSENPLKSTEDFQSSPQGTTTPKIFKSDDIAMYDDDNGNPQSSKMENIKNPAAEILPFSFESGEIKLKSPQETLGANTKDLEDNKETTKTNFEDSNDPNLGFPSTMATVIDTTTQFLMPFSETEKQPESTELTNQRSNESSTEFQIQSRETTLPSISITTILPESEPHGTTAPTIFKSDDVAMYDDDETSHTSYQNKNNTTTEEHVEGTTELPGTEYYDEYVEYYYDDDNTTVLATVGASSIKVNNSTNLPKTFANKKLNHLFQLARGTVSPFITGEEAPNSFPDDYDDSRDYYDTSKSYSEEVSGENH